MPATWPGAALLLLLAACFDFEAGPTAPEAGPNFSKAVNTVRADVVQGDFQLEAGDAPALASTCPGSAGSWSVVFGKTLCLIVKPAGVYEDYEILDDIVLAATIEKGKDGRITHIRLNGQDVDGEAGLWHNTDLVPVAQPAPPAKAGFRLHVHSRNVPVYRYDSHLGRGNRVEMVGTISIGDIVYRQQ